MTSLEDSIRPRLATGCRWANPKGAERMLLFPEGAIRLQGTGRQILELCDGEKTLQEIVTALEALYNGSNRAQIRQEVIAFLHQLKGKRILDY